MQIVSQVELLIFARALVGVFLLQNSLLVPLAYAHFLRSRYYSSIFTRATVDGLVARIDKKANEPGMSPTAKNVWDKLKLFVGRWASGTVIQPQSQAAPAAAPAAGRR
jgi:hypothetical protein